MPKIHNHNLVDREKEYLIILHRQTTKITVQLGPDGSGAEHTLRIAFREGMCTEKEGTEYFTIRPGGSWWEDEIGHQSRDVKLFMRCIDADNQRAEIITWP